MVTFPFLTETPLDDSILYEVENRSTQLLSLFCHVIPQSYNLGVNIPLLEALKFAHNISVSV